MSPTVADYRTSNLLILLMPAVDRLTRQRSRVRVSSSPPFSLKNLSKVLHFRVAKRESDLRVNDRRRILCETFTPQRRNKKHNSHFKEVVAQNVAQNLPMSPDRANGCRLPHA
jgi:hypothetical protein